MNYLNLLTQLFTAIVSLGQAIAQNGPQVVQGIETIWSDVQAAWATVSAAVAANTTLTDDETASVQAVLDNANAALASNAANNQYPADGTKA